MASLKFSLGMIPSTIKIEQQEKALNDEYQKMLLFADSAELARYNELNLLVNSAAFKQTQRETEGLTYKGSPEYNKEKEFQSLDKSKEIRMYLKTRDGSELKTFQALDGSEKINAYEELGKFIESAAFKAKQKMKPITFRDSEEYKLFLEHQNLKKDKEVKQAEKFPESRKVIRFKELETIVNSSEFRAKQQMKPITFKDSEEYGKLQEYNTLKGSSEIKGYYKFKNSKEYANFRKIDGSTMFSRYEELKALIATDEFTSRKNYLLDKKRFEKTEEFAQLTEYETLKKTADIIWYFKVKDSNKFDAIKKRELIFSEEFEGSGIDDKKWLTMYYWGEKLLKDRYSLASDLHFHTEKGNLEVRSSVLSITTKPQKTEGKVWSPTTGFSKKEFSYTSGMINTGKSFRQQYGTFSAKIKLDDPATKNAFWLLGDRIAPHIDICRASRGKVWFDIFRSEKSHAKTSLPGKYAKDFYIYTLEWTPDKLVWKVNGEEVFVQTGNVPQEPMYLSLAGGVDAPISTISNMEVDWIRVYKTV
jgi:hypothetical protein